MATKMTDEHKAAIKAGKKAAKERKDLDVIDLGEGWRIERVDVYNYALYNKDEFSGYFTTLKSAMVSCIHKSIGAGLRGNLDMLRKRIDEIEAWVKSPAFGWDATRKTT